MRCWIAGFLLVFAPLAEAKIRLLVEDPNNVVAGPYSITAQQEMQAKATAESLLSSLREEDLQKALAIRLVVVGAGPHGFVSTDDLTITSRFTSEALTV